MRVLGNRVLVEIPVESKEVSTPGGIILPDSAKGTAVEIGLKIIEVGSEAKGFKKGDYILVEPRSGNAMNVEEGKVLFVDVRNILCVLD